MTSPEVMVAQQKNNATSWQSPPSQDKTSTSSSGPVVASTSTTSQPPGFENQTVSDNHSQQQQQQQQQQQSSGVKNGPSSTALAEHMEGGHRTSSFVNLAAVLGTGLAESMDDATKGENNNNLFAAGNPQQQQQQQRHQTESQGSSSLLHTTRSFNRDEDTSVDLSLARQSRHAAARLIGASPPRVDPSLAGLNLGFFGAPPASLGGGVGGGGAAFSSSSQQYAPSSNSVGGGGGGGYYPSGGASDNNDDGGDYLSAAFSNPASSRDAVDMFGDRRGLMPHHSRDVGLTVMEPGSEQQFSSSAYGSGGVLGDLMAEQQQQQYQQQPQQQQQPLFSSDPHFRHQEQLSPYHSNANDLELARGMNNLWVDRSASNNDNMSTGGISRHSRNYPPSTTTASQQRQQQTETLYLDTQSVGTTSQRSVGSLAQISEADLRGFIWDTRLAHQHVDQYQRESGGGDNNAEPSRCLVILRISHFQVPEIRSTCEAFGVLESFRSDFADRGVIFVSYYDIRSAQHAALEMEGILRPRGGSRSANSTSSANDVAVYYCVPLNSSTQTDESRLILSDIPSYVDQNSLLPLLSSYGAVRALRRHGGQYGDASYEAEYHNIQDARQALLELSSTLPWGPDVAVEVGLRPPVDRKRGRELLAVIASWRKSDASSSSVGGRFEGVPPRLDHNAPVFRGPESSTSSSPAPGQPEMQLVLGPDGRYSYMVVNNQATRYGQSSSDYGVPHRRSQYPPDQYEQPRQQVVHGPNGEVYMTAVRAPSQYPPSYPGTRGVGSQSRDFYPQYLHQSEYANAPYYAEGRDRLDRIGAPQYNQYSAPIRQDPQVMRHQPHFPHSSNASNASVGGDDRDNKNLVLDLDNVEQGRDTRTSLMVRNIPNKYTQQMLLSEFAENGLGPGIIDFFYLPIDFKNRCNRGYAFINFVEFKDILPFHRKYFGKHWSTFNSDKICDITYARIQGKAAMLKRFENSALMEKDEEYKPLVFVSHGPDKGKRIPFPEAAASLNN